ncbi:hypothetical protein MP213Fo_02410 [Pseudochrobactrum sp. MP213Fo]
MTFPLKSRRIIIGATPCPEKPAAVRLGRMARTATLATAIVALAGTVAFLPVPQAHAASNLMELFRQKREMREEQRQQPAIVPNKAAVAPKTKNSTLANKPAAPAVKAVAVRGPQIYDYKPEKLIKIDFSAVDLQLTAAISDVAETKIASAGDDATGMPLRSENEAKRLAAGIQFASVLDAMKNSDIQAEKAIAEAIVTFYATEHTLLWSDGLIVSQQAKDVIALFDKADEDGLSAAEYSVTVPADVFDITNKDQRIREMANFELRLSARALRYALDAGEGRVIANRLSGFHDLPRGRVKPDQVLKALDDAVDPAVVLAAFNPQNNYYKLLKAQLADMRPVQENKIRIAADTLIRPGQSHAELPKILALIASKAPAGYLNSYQDMFDRHSSAQLYDPELVAAVKDYQKLMGKTPDGVIGRATIAALQGESSSVKRERILYAMERLRWLPHDFGQRYVFVNQPAYRAQYFDAGKEQMAMDVVIGSPRNQTHFFYDTIQTVVFNPSWGVPRSIVMNEMMPRILADSSYLDRNNYEVIVGGKKVSSSSVNWSAVAQGKAHVGVRQKPGPSNALGELKILFPNSHDIYLHDTPSKAAFKRDMRAVSHGCIRLADPRAMASAVMSTGQENLTKYFGKNERGIKVPSGVPIYLTYFTAWPDEATGKIRYYDDVYARDEGLAKAFEKTAQTRIAAM